MTSKKQEQTKAALVKRLSEVRIVEIACKSVGISRATFYRWIRDDPIFEQDCDEAVRIGTATISDLAESQIVTKIKGGEIRAAVYWLEHHHSDYAPKPKRPIESPRSHSAFLDRELTDKEFEMMYKVMESLKIARAKNKQTQTKTTN